MIEQIAEKWLLSPQLPNSRTYRYHVIQTWESYGNYLINKYDLIASHSGIKIYRSSIGEPYANVEEMKKDVDRQQLWVSNVNHDHPIWTDEQNFAYRVVHDLDHCKIDASFSWVGENEVAKHQTSYLQDIHIPAMYVETLGGLAVACLTGEFPEQKVM